MLQDEAFFNTFYSFSENEASISTLNGEFKLDICWCFHSSAVSIKNLSTADVLFCFFKEEESFPGCQIVTNSKNEQKKRVNSHKMT